MAVTFFGHRDAHNINTEKLFIMLSEMIENDGVNTFYVGNNGNFDKAVLSVLVRLKDKYKHVEYTVVLAYMPREAHSEYATEYPTILPEEVAGSFPKFAISARNLWMIENSDTVITYVNHNFGGAAKYKALAKKKGKRVIEVSHSEGSMH